MRVFKAKSQKDTGFASRPNAACATCRQAEAALTRSLGGDRTRCGFGIKAVPLSASACIRARQLAPKTPLSCHAVCYRFVRATRILANSTSRTHFFPPPKKSEGGGKKCNNRTITPICRLRFTRRSVQADPGSWRFHRDPSEEQ